LNTNAIRGTSFLINRNTMLLVPHNGKSTMTSTRRTMLFYISALVVASISQVSAIGEILWEESFNYQGSVDPTFWTHEIGNGCDGPTGCGWGNSELQTYTDLWENVNVTNGSLHITALRVGESTSFTSGRIKTQDKVLFKYGRIEARIMVPDIADGLWPAFWTLGYDCNSVAWPASGEIDMFEMGAGSAIAAGEVNSRVTSGAHWSKADGSLAAYALHPTYPYGDLNGEFFTIRMDWTPESISTYILKDGNDDFLLWLMDINATACPDCTEFHQEHFLVLNLAVGGMYTSVPQFRLFIVIFFLLVFFGVRIIIVVCCLQ
jgi:beta-glucanase (GH16 family)